MTANSRGNIRPKPHWAEMMAQTPRLFRSESKKEAREAFRSMAAYFEGKTDKVLDILEDGLEESTQVLVLPARYRRHLRTTKMVERLNEASAVRLVGVLLAEWHEQWINGRRYFDMEEYWNLKQTQAPSLTPSGLGREPAIRAA